MRKTISIVALVIAVCVLIKILFPTPILSLKCHFDDNKSCVELGRDKQSRGDYESSKRIFAKACGLGDIDSCFEVGILYDNGDKVDAIKASEFYLKACEKSKAVSCHKLGNLYQKGLLEKDYKKAVKFYEKACDLGYGKSCHNGGSVYFMGGFGLEADHKKAFGFFKKGCEHDIPIAAITSHFHISKATGRRGTMIKL
ncbi:tetratricopeptide repeat protein [uncultured Campylobacter sp.]|uniref:tetratricopeptide repeat protein n=1 Tax=uncultured Campylobacter sp. TaxID=218934 RepID=UPI00262976C1|nr:tetratricopeptide repeat protein [uncultured Campylobacter sp.]